MIEIRCPACGAIYHAEKNHIGRRFQCQSPNCARILLIGRPTPLSIHQEELVELKTGKDILEEIVRRHDATTFPSGRMGRSDRILIGVPLAVIAIIMLVVAVLWIKAPPPTGPNQPADASRSPSEVAVPKPAQMGRPPCAEGHQPERLSTGARVKKDRGVSGLGRLKIKNGTDYDAAVRVVADASGVTARFVYIRAGEECTLDGIEPGAYQIRWASGNDWVRACRRFLREAGYSEADRALSFSVKVDSEGREISATGHSITLNPVPYGNLGKRGIDRERFLAGDEHLHTEP